MPRSDTMFEEFSQSRFHPWGRMPLSQTKRKKLWEVFQGSATGNGAIEAAIVAFPELAQSTIKEECESFFKSKNDRSNSPTTPRFLTVREWQNTQERIGVLERKLLDLEKQLEDRPATSAEKVAKPQIRFYPEYIQFDEGVLTCPYQVFLGDDEIANPTVKLDGDSSDLATIDTELRILTVSAFGKLKVFVEHKSSSLRQTIDVLPVKPSQIEFRSMCHAEDGSVVEFSDQKVGTANWSIVGRQKPFSSEAYYQIGQQNIVVPTSLLEYKQPWAIAILVAVSTVPRKLIVEPTAELLSSSQLSISAGDPNSLVSKLIVFRKPRAEFTVIGPPVLGIGSVEK